MNNDERLSDYINRCSSNFTDLLYKSYRGAHLFGYAPTLELIYVHCKIQRNSPASYADIHDELTPQYGN